ncbi:MAG: hypothetical protein QXJ75_00900 [Candidatus Bathyarchaeia archaeon]
MFRTVKDKEYMADYIRRHGYVTVKVEEDRTSIGDLAIFCGLLFPYNPRKAKLAEVLLREMSRRKTRRMELTSISNEICRREHCSATTLSQTWKALLNSGLLVRTRRNEPAQLSETFSNRLEMIANYWRERVKEIPKGELAR